MPRSGRRTILKAAVGSLAAAAVSPLVGGETAAASTPPLLPTPHHLRAASAQTLYARYYPFAQPPTGSTPEQAYLRYSAASGKWGISFSGGGPRAFTAALGQMRGLNAAGVLPRIGAISSVSGGSWFGGPFTFAPNKYSDTALLGPLVPPSQITVSGLQALAAPNLGAVMTGLTDEALAIVLAFYITEYELGKLPFDKLWSRVLNAALLEPYGLGSTSALLTLNSTTEAAIAKRNPTLTASFFTPRTDRPFWIASATQIYPTSTASTRVVRQANLPGQIYRPFEFTPMYCGIPQLYTGAGPGGTDFGGGYVETFAFDTPTPSGVNAGDIAVVGAGEYPFLLSDAIGSSSAAIASYVDELSSYSLGFPEFDYWPVRKIGAEAAATYSFGDGGILENTGIVPLLRRGYGVIFAFVNSSSPVGSTDSSCVDGIDGQISRLFGLIPSSDDGNDQNTQIFASSLFAGLASGLKSARAAGQAVVHGGYYPVLASNPFDIAPYTPQIFWVYNDLNEAWFTRLPASVQALFSDDNTSSYLGNFPNYATVLQNHDELLLLTPRQVNLLSNMWAFTMQAGLATSGRAFGIAISRDSHRG